MIHNSAFLILVEEAKKRIQTCDIETFKTRLDIDEDTTTKIFVIDVREHEEYAKGHVPHAYPLCRGSLEVKIESLIQDKDCPLYLYCGGGFRSALAADNLVKMGYTNVVSVDGGFRAWTMAGYPIEM